MPRKHPERRGHQPVFTPSQHSGARSADEAVRLARLARAPAVTLVKLEITPDPHYLCSARSDRDAQGRRNRLVRKDCIVLPYINARSGPGQNAWGLTVPP